MSKRRVATDVTYVYSSGSDSDFAEESTLPTRSKKRRTMKSNKERGAEASSTGLGGQVRNHVASLHKLSNPKPLQTALLGWYAGVHEKRGMPWRKPFVFSEDKRARSQRAYEVWISEIMLQQTQVATVIPYYNRWMGTFPTISDLANANIETVNAVWKGLGYYSRAARLLAGAQKIVREYDGAFPDCAKDMMDNIPGIGRYSAGAISSIAYNHCEPVLDGNVNRLMSRLLALHANPKGKATLDMLWDGAIAMVKDTDAPGDINQALIELGATICKPREPLCGTCPLNAHCNALQEVKGRNAEVEDIEELCSMCEPVQPNEDVGVMKYPMKVEKKKARVETDVVNVVEWTSSTGKRHFLLARRPDTGLLAGLHEFPTHAGVEDVVSLQPKYLQAIAQQVVSDVLLDSIPAYKAPDFFSKSKPERSENTVGGSGANMLRIVKIKTAGDVLHIFSHIRKTYHVQWVLLEGSAAPDADGDSMTNLEQPPALHSTYSFPATSKEGKAAVYAKPTTKGKDKIKKGKQTEKGYAGTGNLAESPKAENSPVLRWVEYEDVQHENVGTGVMKVWKKVNELWSH